MQVFVLGQVVCELLNMNTHTHTRDQRQSAHHAIHKHTSINVSVLGRSLPEMSCEHRDEDVGSFGVTCSGEVAAAGSAADVVENKAASSGARKWRKNLKVQRVVQLAMPEGQGLRLLLHPVLLSLLASSTKKSPTGPGNELF